MPEMLSGFIRQSGHDPRGGLKNLFFFRSLPPKA